MASQFLVDVSRLAEVQWLCDVQGSRDETRVYRPHDPRIRRKPSRISLEFGQFLGLPPPTCPVSLGSAVDARQGAGAQRAVAVTAM